jgi:hypothetical protein
MADLTQLRCLLDSRRVSPLAGALDTCSLRTRTTGAHGAARRTRALRGVRRWLSPPTPLVAAARGGTGACGIDGGPQMSGG